MFSLDRFEIGKKMKMQDFGLNHWPSSGVKEDRRSFEITFDISKLRQNGNIQLMRVVKIFKIF